MQKIKIKNKKLQWAWEFLGQRDTEQRGGASPTLLHPRPLPWMVSSSIRSIPPPLLYLLNNSSSACYFFFIFPAKDSKIRQDRSVS
jgi:hypothetical protein